MDLAAYGREGKRRFTFPLGRDVWLDTTDATDSRAYIGINGERRWAFIDLTGRSHHWQLRRSADSSPGSGKTARIARCATLALSLSDRSNGPLTPGTVLPAQKVQST
jgi:hypothetical protein